MYTAILSSALKSGDDRITLPTTAFLAMVAIVGLLQWSIATTSTLRMPARIKQIISLPLMTACLIMPVMFAGRNVALTVLGGLFAFNTVLRCIEPIYVAPALYGINACLSKGDLNTQLWSCLKKPPGKLEKKKKKRLRSRPFIFVPMVTTMLINEVVTSWIGTFSGEDVLFLQKERKSLFFLFFALAAVVLTLVINAFGYMLQCIYLFTHAKKEYDPDEWRPLMNHPIFASSLDDLWSYRWHQVFRSIWVAIPYKPVCKMITRMRASKSDDASRKNKASVIATATASLAVFFVSGVMHEYLVFCGAGWDAYRSRFIGQECAFFVVHGFGIIVEKTVAHTLQAKRKDGWLWKVLAHAWVILFSFLTFPLFINGFAYWDLWHANPFSVLSPFFINSLWAKYPFLHPFCGSLI